MITQLTTDTFADETSQGKVIVDFFSNTCMPCKALMAQLEELDNEEEETKIVKIEVFENPEVAMEFGVMQVPTVVFLNDGKEVEGKRFTGFRPKEIISEILNA